MSDYQSQQGSFATNVDLIFCIDATGSMRPCIDATKKAATTLHNDIVEALKNSSRIVQKLRLKVIVFRDFSNDNEKSLKTSRFFNLPEETGEYELFVNDIEADGGGKEPESSLEALHLAINSDWVPSGGGDQRRRHIIVLFTDASAHPLDDTEYLRIAKDNPLYPGDAPKTLIELQNEWNSKMDKRAKRLIIFAPDAYPWGEIGDTFNNCIFVPANAAEGLNDVNNEEILKTITQSIVDKDEQ